MTPTNIPDTRRVTDLARLAALGCAPSKWYGIRRPYRYPAEDWFAENTTTGPYVPLLDSCCIIWNGTPLSNGYARMNVDGKNTYVHRWAFREYQGDIPDGMEIDHRCRNPLCQNAGQDGGLSHLEAVPPVVNMRRTPAAMATHCLRDHPFTPENTYRTWNGHRGCRVCRRAMERIGDGYRGDPFGPVGRGGGPHDTCHAGHAWSAANTAFQPNGTRYCLLCRRVRARADYAAKVGRPPRAWRSRQRASA